MNKILVLILSFFLVGGVIMLSSVSAGSVGDFFNNIWNWITGADGKLIATPPVGNASIVQDDWEISRWSGIEKNFEIVIDKVNKEFCIKEKEGFKYEDTSKKKKDIEFELKTTVTEKITVKYDSQKEKWCLSYKNKNVVAGTTIKIGTSTIIAIYQPEKRIRYTNEQLETNFYLYKNGNNSQDLFVYVYNNSYKFGANDSSLGDNITEFSYIINSTDFIFENPMVNYPIFYNEIKKGIVNERYLYDFKDVCTRKFNVTTEEIVIINETYSTIVNHTEEVNADCQWTRLSDNSWKITFNSDKNIDPVITLTVPTNAGTVEKISTGSYGRPSVSGFRLGVVLNNTIYYYDRAFVEYSLSSIMNGSTINYVNLTYTVSSPYDAPNDCAFGSFLINSTVGMTDQNIFENLTNESYNVSDCKTAGIYNVNLTGANVDMQNQLNSGKNWFVLGMKTIDDTAPEYNVTLSNLVLYVNYTYPVNITCGSLTEAGKYNINNDLNANGADCITIASNNIEVNGNGHVIYNGSTGITGNTYKNITFYNLTITNFSTGISLTSIDNANFSNISITRSLDSIGSGMLVSGGQNSTFYNLNILDNDGYGLRVTGATRNSTYDNIVISNCTYGDGSIANLFVSGSNNTFTNMRITDTFSPDGVSTFGIFGIRVSSGSNNTFKNFEIYNSSGHAISLIGVTSRDNTFNNITIVGTNSTQRDFVIVTNSLNRTSIINTSIAKYIISGASGGTLKVEGPSGNIDFLGAINGTGNNLSQDIAISSNLAYVNITAPVTLLMSKSANITLYGVPTTFTNPIIIKDNFKRCGADTIGPCYNFTSLNAGTVIFNVSRWSNYSIVESSETDINSPNINFTYPTNDNGATNPSFIINISSNDSTKEHYTFTDVNRSLISWWRFEDGTGTSFIDDMGLNNATCSVTSCPVSEKGKWGYGLTFDGTNDEIDLPVSNSIINISSNMSFSIWFNTKKNGTEQTFLYVRNGLFLEIVATNLLSWVNLSGMSISACSSSELSISQNKWNHAVFTSNDTSLNIYYNGALVKSCLGTINNKTGSLNVKMGSTFSRYFNGTLDDAILFKRTLNLSEVQSLYNATANQYYNDFSSMPQNTYTYSGYSVDGYGNKNQTETRTINTIDLQPPNCTLISRIPTNIIDNSTGKFSVVINCTDASGVNTTKLGDHYPFFTTRTVDSFILSAGVPNYWSNRYPNNSLGVIGTLTPPYKIWRALGRNEGYWYESLTGVGIKDCTGLSPCYAPINDTFSYAIEDGEYGHYTITNGSNWATINYTHPAVDIAAFRQSVYLSYESMVNETKKNYTIKNNNYLLMKRFDAEAYRNTPNYTMNSFRDIGSTNNPSKTLRAFYCNSSYNPAGSTPVLSSPNCALINAIIPSDLTNIVFTDRNSSYSKGTYAVTNGMFSGIKATAEFYIEYESLETSAVKSYDLRYVNGTTNTDVKFNDTKVAWTTTNGGVTWTQANFTPDVFTTSTIAANDEFQFGYYVCDNVGNCGYNFTFIKDEITPTNHPITRPLVLEYNSSVNVNDIDLNKTHSGIMNIKIGVSTDPDSVGNVTHNLTLRNLDGSWNYTINTSFLAPMDMDLWITFNTSKVPDGAYRMDIQAISGDNPLDIKNFTTVSNFTIDNAPLLANPSANPTSPQAYNPTQAYNFGVELINGTADYVYLRFNNTNYTATKSGIYYNYSFSSLGVGTYTYSWWGNNSFNLTTIGTYTYTVTQATPTLSITLAPSSSVTNPTTTTATGVGCPTQLTCSLYRSNVLVSNPDVQILAIGVYNYIFNTTGNANYTNASINTNLYVSVPSTLIPISACQESNVLYNNPHLPHINGGCT